MKLRNCKTVVKALRTGASVLAVASFLLPQMGLSNTVLWILLGAAILLLAAGAMIQYAYWRCPHCKKLLPKLADTERCPECNHLIMED